jgi:hypothetical protein
MKPYPHAEQSGVDHVQIHGVTFRWHFVHFAFFVDDG